MIIHDFEKLSIWKLSLTLSVDIIKELQGSKNYALKDQITRSSISISSNIAEGSQRNSNKEFVRFLHISKGSAAELYTQLIIAKELREIDEEKSLDFLKRTKEISSMIHGFIGALYSNK